MSDIAFEADRSAVTEFGAVPQTEERRTDSDELSLEELDEANGGLLPLLMAGAFLAGYGAMSLYYDKRGR